MLSAFLNQHITSQAGFIRANGFGYGQVEPNHLSARRNGQIYAQLPADKNIAVLENGQFVKYDYANGLVNFTGAGEWMLVFNEIKLYREEQLDAEFAMVKGNYGARVYSPYGQPYVVKPDGTTQNVADTVGIDGAGIIRSRQYGGTGWMRDDETGVASQGNFEKVTAPADMYELHYNENPYEIEGHYKEAMMPDGTTMVPRVFKTMPGDIFTTNMIADNSVTVGQILVPDASNKGILTVKANPAAGDMQWQVVKVYTMPDHQPGVKVMRIA